MQQPKLDSANLDLRLDTAAPAAAHERIAIVDLADEIGVRKQSLFKVLRRLGVRTIKRRGELKSGNQFVATVTADEANAIRNHLASRASKLNGGAEAEGCPPVYVADEVGFFYLVQLEPDHDEGRFKVGFTAEVEGRLRKHRCAAPFAKCVRSWPCRRTWERAAIDSITDGCEQLYTEVFRTQSLADVVNRGDKFFSVMPALSRKGLKT